MYTIHVYKSNQVDTHCYESPDDAVLAFLGIARQNPKTLVVLKTPDQNPLLSRFGRSATLNATYCKNLIAGAKAL